MQVDAKEIIKNIAKTGKDIGNFFVPKDETEDLQIAAGIDPNSIYGDSKVGQIGSEEIELVLNQGGFELDLMKEGEIQEKNFQGVFPDEVFVASSAVYEENIAKEQYDLVKNYFLALAK
jgi:hypothetical protein